MDWRLNTTITEAVVELAGALFFYKRNMPLMKVLGVQRFTVFWKLRTYKHIFYRGRRLAIE
jgi:hypothetical protein